MLTLIYDDWVSMEARTDRLSSSAGAATTGCEAVQAVDCRAAFRRASPARHRVVLGRRTNEGGATRMRATNAGASAGSFAATAAAAPGAPRRTAFVPAPAGRHEPTHRRRPPRPCSPSYPGAGARRCDDHCGHPSCAWCPSRRPEDLVANREALGHVTPSAVRHGTEGDAVRGARARQHQAARDVTRDRNAAVRSRSTGPSSARSGRRPTRACRSTCGRTLPSRRERASTVANSLSRATRRLSLRAPIRRPARPHLVSDTGVETFRAAEAGPTWRTSPSGPTGSGARYRDESGREHAKHFDREIDAQRWLDEVTARRHRAVRRSGRRSHDAGRVLRGLVPAAGVESHHGRRRGSRDPVSAPRRHSAPRRLAIPPVRPPARGPARR